MTVAAVEEVLRRAREDVTFRQQLSTEPDAALHGYDIAFDERTALIAGDANRLSQLGVDPDLAGLARYYHPDHQDSHE